MSGTVNTPKQDASLVPTPAAGRATFFVGTDGNICIREDDGSLRSYLTALSPTVAGDAVVFSNTMGGLADAGAAPVLAGGAAGGDLAGTYPNPMIKASVALGGIPTAPTAAFGDNSAAIATTAFVQSAVAGLWDYRGGYDASGNLFPSAGGSGTGGAILQADAWTITVAGTEQNATAQKQAALPAEIS